MPTSIHTSTRRVDDTFRTSVIKSALFLTLILFGAQMFCEVVYRLTILRPFFSIGLLHTALFALTRAAVLGSLIGFFPKKAAGVLYRIVLFAIPVVYGSQFVYYRFFRTFFVAYSVERSGQVTEFLGDIVLKILQNAPILLSFFLPYILATSLPKMKRVLDDIPRVVGWKRALAGLGCGVLLFGLSVGSMAFNRSFNSPWQNFFHQNEMLIGSHQFGVLTAIEIDVRRYLFPPAHPDDPWEGAQIVTKGTSPVDEQPAGDDAEAPEPGAPKAHSGDPQIWDIDFETRHRGYTLSEDHRVQPTPEETFVHYLDRVFSDTEPTYTNDHTGRGKGFNLIFITAESFSPYCIDPEVTPTLYKMYRDGIQFTNYYNPIWSVSTLDGEYAGLCGMLPKQGVWSLSQTSGNDMSYAPGNFLRHLGYNTFAWHDHTWTYYGRDQSHPNLGYEYRGVGNGLDLENVWPEADSEMIEKTVPGLIDKEPFHVYYLTVSGHMPYTRSGNAMADRHWDVYADREGLSEEAKSYLASNYEVELAMRSLLGQLKEAGILDHTLIVLNPDHYPYALRHSTLEELAGRPLDETFDIYKSVLLFYHEGIEPERVDKYCSSVDILPTVYNYMGIPYESRLLSGRDIFSDAEGLVCLLGKSWITARGQYDALSDTFTLHAGVALEVPEAEYVARVNREVMLRFQTAELVLDCDYYRGLLTGDQWEALAEPYRAYMKRHPFK